MTVLAKSDIGGFVALRVMNMGLRGLTLFSKFLLIFLLARYLEPVEVGLYGLLAATIVFAIYPLGFDFYTYSTREIVATERSRWLGLLKNQAVLFVLLYLVFLPLFILIFFLGLLPWALAPFFFAILITEHLGQEANRLLVAISHPLLAGFVLFLRSGLWVLILVPVFVYFPEARSLNSVFSLWLLFGLVALALSGLPLMRLDRKRLHDKVNWEWLKKGLKVAVPFLLATLAIRFLFMVDRYYIEYFSGLEVVAAYVFFIGVASALISFLDAGVFVFYYPKMIRSVQGNEEKSFYKAVFLMTVQVVVVCLFFFLLASLLIDPLLSWLDRPIYRAHVNFLPWLLLAFSLNAISMLPHYCLYAAGLDRFIVLTHLFSPLVFFSSVALLHDFQHLSVVYSLVATMAWLAVSKSVCWILMKNKIFDQPFLNN